MQPVSKHSVTASLPSNSYNSGQQQLEPPWYKQFWPWFLIALPASSVVAGLITVYIAVNGADDLVKPDYYKQGLAINQLKQKQQVAAQMGLSGQLTIQQQALELILTGSEPLQESLTLTFRHAAFAEKDFVLPLKQRADGSYFAELQQQVLGKWHITLKPYSDAWQVDAVWVDPSRSSLQIKG